MSSKPSTSVLPKACENCRIRKIRCNRSDPCSNCEASGIECKPAVKTTEHRPRVLLSANYEKQIEIINERLHGIEKAVRSLTLRDKGQLSSPAHSETISIQKATTGPPSSGPTLDTPAPFEGASSFTDQALRAGQMAEMTAGTIFPSAEISDALSSLKTLLSVYPPAATDDLRFDPASASKDIPEMQLLPAAFVIALLRYLKVKPSFVLLTYAIRDKLLLDRLCQKVYFPTEPLSIGILTSMHGTIYYLLKEFTMDPDCPLNQEYDLKAYGEICERNFHAGIETYEIIARPTHDNAQALMLGMLKAQEESKPLLCWTLVSCAARHVLSLGYHRKASMRNDTVLERNEKKHIFWTVYMFDKNMALNLGRTPNIQDYDLDIDMFDLSAEPGIRPWDEAAVAFIQLSRIQGEMYEKLYSFAALNSGADQRSQHIEEILGHFNQWYHAWKQIDASNAWGPTWFDISYKPMDVTFYSLLCTLHRASSMSGSTTEITSACYDAANRSLRCHLEFFPQFLQYSGDILWAYVSWTLLYSSFTPLIVVFLHAIAASSQEDVELLQAVEESFAQIKHDNKEFLRVHGVCKIFCKFARAFVNSNRTFVGSYNAQDDSIVLPHADMMAKDQFFAAPNGGGILPDLLAPDGTVNNYNVSDVSMFFGNWLGGNQPVMDLWNNIDLSDNSNM